MKKISPLRSVSWFVSSVLDFLRVVRWAWSRLVLQRPPAPAPASEYEEIRDTSIIPSSHEAHSTDLEEYTAFYRSNGKQVTYTLCWVDSGDPIVSLATWTEQDQHKGEPSESIELTIAEAWHLRALLNRPTVATILDDAHRDGTARLLPSATREEAI